MELLTDKIIDVLSYSAGLLLIVVLIVAYISLLFVPILIVLLAWDALNLLIAGLG